MGSLPSSSSSSCDLTNPSLLPASVKRRQPPQNQQQRIPSNPTSSTTKRRALTLSLFPFLLFPHSSSSSSSAASLLSSPPTEPSNTTQLKLESYTDAAQGFTLLIPSSWSKVDKAGATTLFEEGEGSSSSNNIGIVVTPVRLSSLKDFGTPQFVADKLIQAERRKESTKQAEAIAVAERLGHGGLPVYEFEYIVDSTRGGMKRVFSAAFVASKKLYLLNIAHADKPDSPLDGQTRMVLEQVLHSFDIAL